MYDIVKIIMNNKSLYMIYKKRNIVKYVRYCQNYYE